MRHCFSGTAKAPSELACATTIIWASCATEAIKRVVATSDGLGCLSRYAVVQSVADGHLVELRTRLPRAGRQLAIVLHLEKRLGRATTDFLAHCSAAEQHAVD